MQGRLQLIVTARSTKSVVSNSAGPTSGTSLDRVQTSYYCREGSKSVSFFYDPVSHPKLKICLCLLLAALFLYNPFLTATPWPAGLNIRHSASYRATVASSELQHFSPTNGRTAFAISAGTPPPGFEFRVNLPLATLIQVSTNQPCVYKFLSAALWFRPPPSI